MLCKKPKTKLYTYYRTVIFAEKSKIFSLVLLSITILAMTFYCEPLCCPALHLIGDYDCCKLATQKWPMLGEAYSLFSLGMPGCRRTPDWRRLKTWLLVTSVSTPDVETKSAGWWRTSSDVGRLGVIAGLVISERERVEWAGLAERSDMKWLNFWRSRV